MYLTTDTKQILEMALGKTIWELANMSVDEENTFVKAKTGRKPIFSKIIDYRMTARGSHQLVQKRIATMESIDEKIMGWKIQ